ncbi:transposase, Mutator family protein [Mycobacterium bohemicum DSM 44277]|uniref:Mutator family transposase n=1 Tax=Mycobacterium bohemicum DSM 44277 TaxID=1236609 RepID=A0A0U0W4Y5_MYCBE|nr:transposase, Mutator family protein [Mycobacterium bohemicum DSM 44277]
MRYASFTDRRKMAATLRPIYIAATEEAAKLALEEFRSQWHTKSPSAVAVGDRAWAECVSFLAFPVEIRRIIYTTNAVESLNYQLHAERIPRPCTLARALQHSTTPQCTSRTSPDQPTATNLMTEYS